MDTHWDLKYCGSEFFFLFFLERFVNHIRDVECCQAGRAYIRH